MTNELTRPMSYADAPEKIRAIIREKVWDLYEDDITAEVQRAAYDYNCDELGAGRRLIRIYEGGNWGTAADLHDCWNEDEMHYIRAEVLEALAWSEFSACHSWDLQNTCVKSCFCEWPGQNTRKVEYITYRDMDYHAEKQRAYANHEIDSPELEAWLETAWRHVMGLLNSYIYRTEEMASENAYDNFHATDPWDDWTTDRWCENWCYDAYTGEIYERAHVSTIEEAA